MAVAAELNWWKYTATASVAGLLSMATTVGGFWFGGAREFVTERQVREIVVAQNPWIADKGKIEQTLDALERSGERNAQAVSDLTKIVHLLAEKQSELVGELRAMRVTDRGK